MAGTLLVRFPLEAGSRLIAELDALNFSIKAALWLYKPEMDSWELIIATPLVGKLGPLKTYEKLRSVLKGFGPQFDITLDDVTVVKPSSNLIRSLRDTVRVAVGDQGVRLRRNALPDAPEDTYIYRML